MTITLYGGRKTRAFRCHWTLTELDTPYEEQEIDFRAGDHRSEAFLKINPNGKVPALTDDTGADNDCFLGLSHP